MIQQTSNWERKEESLNEGNEKKRNKPKGRTERSKCDLGTDRREVGGSGGIGDSWPCWTRSADHNQGLWTQQRLRGLGRKTSAGLDVLNSEVPESLRRGTNLVNTGE